MSVKKSTFPEEKIRLKLIEFMVDELLYPVGVISVERSLSSFPHLKGKKVPNRRFDIAVFGTEELIPLLVIECKACPFTEKSFEQVIGYNHLVHAPFIALANEDGVITLIKEGEKYHQYKGLPDYQVLIDHVKGCK